MGKETTGSPNFQHFAQIAQRFCSVVESFSELSKEQLLDELYRILPRLIGAGIDLQMGEPETTE